MTELTPVEQMEHLQDAFLPAGVAVLTLQQVSDELRERNTHAADVFDKCALNEEISDVDTFILKEALQGRDDMVSLVLLVSLGVE